MVALDHIPLLQTIACPPDINRANPFSHPFLGEFRMKVITRVGAVCAVLGAIACGQSDVEPQGQELAAGATALEADATLAAEAAAGQSRVGTRVSAKSMLQRIAPATDEQVTVVVQLQGDSVAEVRGQSADR